jgi:hypothetical protein
MLCGAYYLPLAALNIPSPFVVLVGLVALSVFIGNWNVKKLGHPLMVCFGLLIFLAGISLLYTSNPYPWKKFLDYVQSGALLLLLLLLVLSSSDVLRIVGWIALLSALSVVVSLTHYHLGLEKTYLGIKIYSLLGEEALVGKATLSNLDLTRRYIWAGMDPNFYGMVLLAGFMASLALWESKVLKIRGFYLGCLVLNGIGILGSYSRSALVVAAIGVFIYYLSLRKIPLTAVIIGSTLITTFLIVQPKVLERIGSIQENFSETGGTGRLNAARNGIRHWSRFPFGHGIGSAQVDFTPETGGDAGTTHSTYLEILTELGPQGLGLFCYMIYYALQRCRMNRKRLDGAHEVFVAGVAANVITLVIFVATIPVSQFGIFFVMLVVACQKYKSPTPLSLRQDLFNTSPRS